MLRISFISVLSITACLFIKAIALDVQSMHPHWRRHIDRIFSISNLFPIIGRLAGTDGNVLEVGYERYNNHDARLAEVPASRWYNVDLYDYGNCNQSYSGHLIIHPKGFLGLGKEYDRKFRVIYDNTLQFYANTTMRNQPVLDGSTVVAHVDRYKELLQPGGWLIFRLDGWNASKI
jgi:hypothetical protein